MLFNCYQFIVSWVCIYIYSIKNFGITFCSGTVVKYYSPQSITYIDVDRTPGFIMQDLPEWVNNYNRVLSNEKYEYLLQNTSIDYHTSDRCLYIWDSTAHLPFDYITFFVNLFCYGGILYSVLFFCLISLNLAFLWFIFLSIHQKNIAIFFTFFNKKCFFFLLCPWFFTQYLFYIFDLITFYPEEWAFALIIILFIVFLDLFWGACLLDFKIITVDQDAYTFFYGLHFEFLTFIFLFNFFVTVGLDFLGFIELLGENEHWTKWD